jgi:hypothetical protein
VPPTATYVILYVNGFGRFPAVTTRYSDGAIGMRFDLSGQKRQMLTAQIKAYVKAGITGVTSVRRYNRVPCSTENTFMRENGEETACSIREFSLQGAFLETASRPPLGELITVGPHRGLVIRHEPKGFAIHFVTARDCAPRQTCEN